MHDRLDHLKDAVDSIGDAEKLQLIEYLVHSLRAGRNAGEYAEAVERQHQAFVRLQKELATLPEEDDPYAHLGCADQAHDKIIYDLEQR